MVLRSIVKMVKINLEQRSKALYEALKIARARMRKANSKVRRERGIELALDYMMV